MKKRGTNGRRVTATERKHIRENTSTHIYEGRNMYGCTACPNCGSGCRFATQDVHPTEPSRIVCDDCGRSKPYVKNGVWFDEAGELAAHRAKQ